MELGPLMSLIQEAKSVKADLERKYRRQGRVSSNSHTINYDLIYKILEKSKEITLDTLKVKESKRSDVEIKGPLRRRSSNVSDLSGSGTLNWPGLSRSSSP